MDVLENGDYKGKKRVVKSKFFCREWPPVSWQLQTLGF